MPARTPASKAKPASGAKASAAKVTPSAAKATPKSPSLGMGDDTGNIASSKKQLNFKTPRAAAAADAAKSSAKKRPLAIQEEEEEPAAKKGKTPGKVSKKVAQQYCPPALYQIICARVLPVDAVRLRCT
jgi:hypothetical protein